MTTLIRRAGGLLCLALTAAVVAACGGAATPPPSTVATPSSAASASAPASPSPATSPSPVSSSGLSGDSGTVSIVDSGFTITLADDWPAFELDQAGVASIAKQFPADSQIGQLLSGQVANLAIAGVKLFAVDAAATAPSATGVPTLNVIVQPKPPGLSIQLLGQLAKSQLEGLDAVSSVSVKDVDLSAGPAVMATYELSQSLADGSTVNATARQYYLTSDDSLFIVTMTGGGSDSMGATFDTMAESISLG